MSKGCFITIEGTEGVGKTTNMQFIQQYLVEQGKDIVLTREPGGTQLGEAIRELLLGHAHTGMASDTELLLMFAARAEHIDKVIRPALKNGQWVLCDRFTDATYAYQGGGRGIDKQRIAVLENWVQGELRPDATLLLDIDIETGLQRAGDRSEPDRFEKEKHDFFHRVRDAYISRSREDAARFHIINASEPLDTVQSAIRRVLDILLTAYE